MNSELLNKSQIDEIINHPYERIFIRLFKDDYIILCSFEYRNQGGSRIECKLNCSDKENKSDFGSVKFSINIFEFISEQLAHFGDLEVSYFILEHGVGTALMQIVFGAVRALKRYYGINETIKLSGWLSQADNNDEHWGRSIPFYESLGKREKVDFIFYIEKTQRTVKTKEDFFKYIGDSDGKVVFYIL